MIVGNNISPLPFYPNASWQNHRKEYAYGQVYPLIASIDTLLPFQIVVDGGTEARIDGLTIVSYKTGYSRRIDQEMEDAGMTITSYPEMDISVISFPGDDPGLQAYLSEGPYYLIISVSTSKGRSSYYSEIFTLRKDVSDYLEIQYGNTQNLATKNGIIQFEGGFKFKCYLDTQVGKPEYVFEEEATERMGYTFIESQVSKKIYRFTFLAPEYLCDALRIARLCDTKQIKTKLQTYDLSTFSMQPQWEEQGDLAAVECEFETDTVIANLGGTYVK